MGNEGSKGLVIDKNAVEANDFWALYNASTAPTNNGGVAGSEDETRYLSVFQGEPVVTGQLWVSQGPMERAIKNQMIYRHPYILKYVSNWEQGGQKHLATERVRPLNSVLNQQSDIQICLGLRTILCSLIFLVEKAMARHLNICTDSIYVTDSGSWRLAGFEYVWKQKEVTKTLLDYAKAYRYQAALDPDESKEENMNAIEQFAFATLCEEILTKQFESHKYSNSTPIPHVQDFKDYCATHLKHKNAQMRPKLSAVLLHPYFNHEFVLIHAFLFELPLKNNNEKQDFFTGLIDRLRYFDEEIVGAQFAGDLLSRMVLLDTTAQLCVTPYVLRTKTDHSSALFSGSTYCKYLMPHILKMFRLKDAQIRLILLEYFMEFVRLLSKEDLEVNILPHLVVGMQDTNDVLVAKTLRCMADLVPILGAAAVLGSQRTRLFSDGRPQAAISASHWVEPRSITPVLGEGGDCPIMVSGSPIPDNCNSLSKSNSYSSLSQAAISDTYEHNMPPRLSPDGGEDVKSAIIQDNKELQDGDDDDEADVKVEKVSKEEENTNFSKDPKVREVEKQHAVNENLDADDDDDAWSDWENDEEVEQTLTSGMENQLANISTNKLQQLSSSANTTSASSSYNTLTSQTSSSNSFKTTQSNNNSSSTHSSLAKVNTTSITDDLSCLDIQVQKTPATGNTENSEDFDFFKDMEPVIIASQKPLQAVSPPTTYKWLEETEENIKVDSSRFVATDVGAGNDDDSGWQIDDDDDVDIEGRLHDLVSTNKSSSSSAASSS